MKNCLYLIILGLSFNAMAIKTRKCNREEQRSLHSYTRDAHSYVRRWKSNLKQYRNLNWMNRLKVATAQRVLSCIAKKLDKIKYKCNAWTVGENYAAKTH